MELPSYVENTIAALLRAGYRPYLVGGCVRDLLRGAVPSDYDVTSDALPEQVMELFGAAAHPTGIAHGTVTVADGGRGVEITTMRRDGVYRDGRHPDSVMFTDRIEQDLARRDFTVNAMALAPDGTLVDPFGGRADLACGVLRCVGEPRERFEEDALRILRALRFASVLGFAIEEETARAARACRGLLDRIAGERVYAELDRLLTGADVTRVLLDFPDVLGAVLPEILPCVGFDQRNRHHCHDVWAHTAYAVGAVKCERPLRWTMLFHDLGKPETFTVDEQGVGHFYGHTAVSARLAAGIMERLHFEKALRTAVETQLECFDDQFPAERAALHKEMAARGRVAVAGLLETRRADSAAQAEADRLVGERTYALLRELYDELVAERACCSVSELAVNGRDIKEIGFTGKTVGAVLARLLWEVASEKLENKRPALLRRAERLYRSGYGRQGGNDG